MIKKKNHENHGKTEKLQFYEIKVSRKFLDNNHRRIINEEEEEESAAQTIFSIGKLELVLVFSFFFVLLLLAKIYIEIFGMNMNKSSGKCKWPSEFSSIFCVIFFFNFPRN